MSIGGAKEATFGIFSSSVSTCLHGHLVSFGVCSWSQNEDRTGIGTTTTRQKPAVSAGSVVPVTDLLRSRARPISGAQSVPLIHFKEIYQLWSFTATILHYHIWLFSSGEWVGLPHTTSIHPCCCCFAVRTKFLQPKKSTVFFFFLLSYPREDVSQRVIISTLFGFGYVLLCKDYSYI